MSAAAEYVSLPAASVREQLLRAALNTLSTQAFGSPLVQMSQIVVCRDWLNVAIAFLLFPL